MRPSPSGKGTQAAIHPKQPDWQTQQTHPPPTAATNATTPTTATTATTTTTEATTTKEIQDIGIKLPNTSEPKVTCRVFEDNVGALELAN